LLASLEIGLMMLQKFMTFRSECLLSSRCHAQARHTIFTCSFIPSNFIKLPASMVGTAIYSPINPFHRHQTVAFFLCVTGYR
jgi:hypothetical protein